MSRTLLDTTRAFFEALSNFNTQRLAEVLSVDYVHTFAPSSEEFGPALTRDEFVNRFEAIKPVLQGLEISMIQHWVNEAGKTVTAYAQAKPLFRDVVKKGQEDEVEEWDFRGEYMFVFEMDADGTNIVKTLEFVEGKVAARMREQVRKAFEKLSGASLESK